MNDHGFKWLLKIAGGFGLIPPLGLVALRLSRSGPVHLIAVHVSGFVLTALVAVYAACVAAAVMTARAIHRTGGWRVVTGPRFHTESVLREWLSIHMRRPQHAGSQGICQLASDGTIAVMEKINGRDIEAHETEWAIRWDDGEVMPTENEEHARHVVADAARISAGSAEVVVREVYRTAWAASS